MGIRAAKFDFIVRSNEGRGWAGGSFWLNPDFKRLWLGQRVSAFGSPFTREGLPLVAVITLSTSAHQSSLLAAAAVALVLLFALVAGVRLDRIGDALFSSQPICGVRSSCCWHRSLPGLASCGSSC